MEQDWPFDDPPNVITMTTRHVLEQHDPILLVSHDADDGCWQVLCGTTNDPDDGRVVGLACLYAIDPSIGALADLPRGWIAWRPDPNAPWQRAPKTDDEYMSTP
jgi:hypothetical protein